MPKALIEVRHLVNQFGTQRVHDDVNMIIYPNEIVGVAGGSGAGKSVLLRSILGLEKPVAGEIYFQGRELTRMPAAEFAALKQRWGVMFQRGALFSSLSVGDNILFPMREYATLPVAASQQLMQMRLKMVGLEPAVASKFPAELSGGMVKRVALARALALDPIVLFLDEPTSGLDPVSAQDIDQLIANLHRNLGLTVLMVTHDLDSLHNICDRIALVVDKKVVMGTWHELVSTPAPSIQHYFASGRAKALQQEG